MLISKTYETWNQDDIEHGDTDKKGFIYQDENYSFKDLLDELKDECYLDLCCSDINQCNSITYYGSPNYVSGEVENLTLHFNGTDRQKKYWIKALKIHLEIKD
tara:strand:- start:487 stop:795 length:309 start_codon:yes stop_codon:yes gene_type:complete